MSGACSHASQRMPCPTSTLPRNRGSSRRARTRSAAARGDPAAPTSSRDRLAAHCVAWTWWSHRPGSSRRPSRSRRSVSASSWSGSTRGAIAVTRPSCTATSTVPRAPGRRASSSSRSVGMARACHHVVITAPPGASMPGSPHRERAADAGARRRSCRLPQRPARRRHGAGRGPARPAVPGRAGGPAVPRRPDGRDRPGARRRLARRGRAWPRPARTASSRSPCPVGTTCWRPRRTGAMSCAPLDVTVAATGTAEVVVSCDTGIR